MRFGGHFLPSLLSLRPPLVYIYSLTNFYILAQIVLINFLCNPSALIIWLHYWTISFFILFKLIFPFHYDRHAETCQLCQMSDIVIFSLCANCLVPGQQGLTVSVGWHVALGQDLWPLIGHLPQILVPDWSVVKTDAFQTWWLPLSVMYWPLRRHTYHSVTNNTNSSETILLTYWSRRCRTFFLFAKNITSLYMEVNQKVNKHTTIGSATS